MARKRKLARVKDEDASPQGDGGATKEAVHVKEEENGFAGEIAGCQVLTDLEKARNIIIARNLARLEALNLPKLTGELRDIAGAQDNAKKTHKVLGAPRRKLGAPEAEGGVPARRSSRRIKTEGGADAGRTPAGEAKADFDEELGRFIVDGECPRCSKVVTKAHAKHLGMCSGRGGRARGAAAAREASLADLVKIEVRREEHEETKLQELDLGGLVRVTDTHALFIVVGSKGNHYKVKIKGCGRTCECMDHRCRKHDCKHIRLLLKMLDIEDHPSDWHEAVDEMLLQQAGSVAPTLEAGFVPQQSNGPPPSADALMAAKFL